MEDRIYCMSSFLMFRSVLNTDKCFKEGRLPNNYKNIPEQRLVYSSEELEEQIKLHMHEWTQDGKAALALSGGIDSAILAKFMQGGGGKAYTFRCIVPGMEVTNEVPQAVRYAEECGLDHEVIEITWEDMIRYAPILMEHKNAPIHSIEVQIYLAAVKAKTDGYTKFIFGETSDINYGGMSQLMSRDWTIGEFIERYSYVMPYKALKKYEMITEPFEAYEKNGYEDVHEFLRNFTLKTSMGSYMNACQCAGIEMLSPYLLTKMGVPIDYDRIRRGENKYLVREIFKRLYPDYPIPEKLPMPRPMNEWFKDWKGPVRSEFWPHCTDNMNGDQKWLIWCLEKYLNMLDEV